MPAAPGGNRVNRRRPIEPNRHGDREERRSQVERFLCRNRCVDRSARRCRPVVLPGSESRQGRFSSRRCQQQSRWRGSRLLLPLGRVGSVTSTTGTSRRLLVCLYCSSNAARSQINGHIRRRFQHADHHRLRRHCALLVLAVTTIPSSRRPSRPDPSVVPPTMARRLAIESKCERSSLARTASLFQNVRVRFDLDAVPQHTSEGRSQLATPSSIPTPWALRRPLISRHLGRVRPMG